MSSVNKAILIGNVGRDPEIRSTGSGDRVANLSVATSERWKDRNSGEWKERTEWHRITVWGDGLVGVVEQYVEKGSKLYVEGQIQTRKWKDQSGNDKYSTEIVLQGFNAKLVLLDGRKDGTDDRDDDTESRDGYGMPTTGRRPAGDLDDDIPFAPSFF